MRPLLLVLLLLLAACGADSPAERATPALPTPAPLPTLMPTSTAAPAPTSPADTGWLAAAPGAELRRLRVAIAGHEAPVSIIRLDPALVSFSVGYRPADPPPLVEWVAASGALAVINGGFFDMSGQTVALIVHDGVPVGASYEGRGGMFAVSSEGVISLRSLADTPYDPAEPIAEALQGWPMLVRPGGEAAYSYEDGARERRSAVGIDRDGRILLIAAPTPAFTLAELSTWLATTDLDLDSALNLDGGSSTGMLLVSNAAPERIEAFAPLPIVLLAHPR